MTNDLNTLSGALLEMKDQLIYELGQKGVTATYSSSTGLLGLIGKIGDIQTGGGGSCYHIEFVQSSYTATGGTATVSVYLQSNYAPLSGATVTFTSSTSTSTTATTDSNGIATATITFSASTTLTASYSNVSDTASVTYSNIYFLDECSTNNTSQYSTTWCYRYENTLPSLTFSSSTNGYQFSRSTSKDTFSGYIIPNCQGLDNVKIRMKVKLNNSSSDAYNQFAIGMSDSTYNAYNTAFSMFRIRGDNKADIVEAEGHETSVSSSVSVRNAWRYVEIAKSGSSVTFKVYDDNLSQLTTKSHTLYFSYTNPYFFFVLNNNTSNTKYIKEIRVEPIS